MRQIGAKPDSQLGLLEETVVAVRSLLAGEEVHADGAYVHLDGVQLAHPPAEVPPIYTGVRRARSLALSGRVADGTVLSEPSSVPYVEWALDRIAATRPHRLVVYAWCSVDADPESARSAVRPLLAERLVEGGPQVEQPGIAGDVARLISAGGVERLEADMPDEWIDRMAVVGTSSAQLPSARLPAPAPTRSSSCRPRPGPIRRRSGGHCSRSSPSAAHGATRTRASTASISSSCDRIGRACVADDLLQQRRVVENEVAQRPQERGSRWNMIPL